MFVHPPKQRYRVQSSSNEVISLQLLTAYWWTSKFARDTLTGPAWKTKLKNGQFPHFCMFNGKCRLVCSPLVVYRVILVVSELGWVDLDLRCSLGWWAATVVTYCPSRMVEHLKSKST